MHEESYSTRDDPQSQVQEPVRHLDSWTASHGALPLERAESGSELRTHSHQHSFHHCSGRQFQAQTRQAEEITLRGRNGRRG